MTTIAVCKDWIAADSRLVVGERITNAPKLFRICGSVFGGSGDAALIELARAWIARGSKVSRRPSFKSDADFDGLICNGRSLVYLESELVPIEVSAPFAIGSGSEYAMALMSTGMTAPEAVRHIIEKQLDPNTGGTVQCIGRAGRHRRQRSKS